MAYTRLLLRSLLIPLFATSFYILWIRNSGFFSHINETIRSGHQIDGAPVRTEYTGIGKVDEILTIFVTFYYPLVSQAGRDALGDWLVGDMIPTTVLFTTACIAEGYRERQSNGFGRWWIALPGLWMLSYQLLGMAVVMPLFTFFQLENSKTSTKRTLQPVKVQVSNGLLPAALIGGYAPMLLTVLPLGLNSNVMQKTIALCQLYPILIAIILAAFYYQPGAPKTEVAKTKSNIGVFTMSYALLAFIATVVHLLTLLALHHNGNFLQGLKDFYLLDFVNDVKTPLGATTLFLKFDALVAGIAGFIWVGVLASDAGVRDVWTFMGIAALIGGPGAAIGAGLFLREGRIPKKALAVGQRTYGTTSASAVPAVEARVEG